MVELCLPFAFAHTHTPHDVHTLGCRKRIWGTGKRLIYRAAGKALNLFPPLTAWRLFAQPNENDSQKRGFLDVQGRLWFHLSSLTLRGPGAL